MRHPPIHHVPDNWDYAALNDSGLHNRTVTIHWVLASLSLSLTPLTLTLTVTNVDELLHWVLNSTKFEKFDILEESKNILHII